MLLTFADSGLPIIQNGWEKLGSGVVSHVYAIPGDRVLKVASTLDGTLAWLEYCHAILRKHGPDHPRMHGKPRVYQLLRFTDAEGTNRYWCIMERLKCMDYGGPSFSSLDCYKLVKEEAKRMLGIAWLDDHSGNVMYRRDADGDWDYNHPILVDPCAASYELGKPSQYKHLSAPKRTQ